MIALLRIKFRNQKAVPDLVFNVSLTSSEYVVSIQESKLKVKLSIESKIRVVKRGRFFRKSIAIICEEKGNRWKEDKV